MAASCGLFDSDDDDDGKEGNTKGDFLVETKGAACRTAGTPAAAATASAAASAASEDQKAGALKLLQDAYICREFMEALGGHVDEVDADIKRLQNCLHRTAPITPPSGPQKEKGGTSQEHFDSIM